MQHGRHCTLQWRKPHKQRQYYSQKFISQRTHKSDIGDSCSVFNSYLFVSDNRDKFKLHGTRHKNVHSTT